MNEVAELEEYEGVVVPIGNSRGVRLPSGFFKSHPEFSGKVKLTVVADGEVLVSARQPARPKTVDDEADPVVATFLRYLDNQMAARPEAIVPADPAQLRRIGKLVSGVKPG
jgi:antitoxin PrlF